MDTSLIPFSMFGSYLAVSRLKDGVYLRKIGGEAPLKELLRIQLAGCGAPQMRHGDGLLRLECGAAWAEICFESADCLRIRGCGAPLKLSTAGSALYGTGAQIRPGRYQFSGYASRSNIVLDALAGAMVIEDRWDGANSTGFCAVFACEGGDFDVAVEVYRGTAEVSRKHDASFDECAAARAREFETYLEKTVQVPARYKQARREAAYLNWSSVVPPDGLMQRYGMYMSKNWMTNIWSWDHCFNAIALGYSNPELAWEQIMAMFDRQDETGALPDSFNNTDIVWQFCKPPVHGWAIKKLFECNSFFGEEHIRQIYKPLCRWTDWWFRYRDYDGDGMPQYNHGNDSGWDNSTLFAQGVPVESPDLAAFLLIQMDVLAEMAELLGLYQEAEEWSLRAQTMVYNFEKHFVGPDFSLHGCLSGTHEAIECRSLLPYIALVAGQRLPLPVLQKAVADLKAGGWITEFGLATEDPASPHYVDDGYWRGPIWAPSSMLLIDGLAACGEQELAASLAERFADMCVAQGFAENFDALSGHWLRDPAYTWTSSVFLALAHDYLQ